MKAQSNHIIMTGDRVSFNARGRLITGTVTNTKISKPGSRSAIARAGLVMTIRVRKLEVVPDEGGGIWTVAEHSCKRLGRATTSRTAAAHAQKSFMKQQRDKRANDNLLLAEKKGLLALNHGDKILVEFRGGSKLECRFQRITNAGLIGFWRAGDHKFDALGLTETPRVRFTAPEYVEKVASPVVSLRTKTAGK